MLSVDQVLRLISVPAVVAAFLIASQVSGAGIFHSHASQYSNEWSPWNNRQFRHVPLAWACAIWPDRVTCLAFAGNPPAHWRAMFEFLKAAWTVDRDRNRSTGRYDVDARWVDRRCHRSANSTWQSR